MKKLGINPYDNYSSEKDVFIMNFDEELYGYEE